LSITDPQFRSSLDRSTTIEKLTCGPEVLLIRPGDGIHIDQLKVGPMKGTVPESRSFACIRHQARFSSIIASILVQLPSR
jgi:hypothetical protein